MAMPRSESSSRSPQPITLPPNKAPQRTRTGRPRKSSPAPWGCVRSVVAIADSPVFGSPLPSGPFSTCEGDAGAASCARPDGSPARGLREASAFLAMEQPLEIRAVADEDDGGDGSDPGDAPARSGHRGDEERGGYAGQGSDARDPEQFVENDPDRGAANGGERRQRERHSEPGGYALPAPESEPDRVAVADHGGHAARRGCPGLGEGARGEDGRKQAFERIEEERHG